jgi:cell division protein FtsB
LKKDLQGQELAKRKEYETKVEALKQDKKKLETQIKKLKQRWDELVESAKKRREDSQKDNKS